MSPKPRSRQQKKRRERTTQKVKSEQENTDSQDTMKANSKRSKCADSETQSDRSYSSANITKSEKISPCLQEPESLKKIEPSDNEKVPTWLENLPSCDDGGITKLNKIGRAHV